LTPMSVERIQIVVQSSPSSGTQPIALAVTSAAISSSIVTVTTYGDRASSEVSRTRLLLFMFFNSSSGRRCTVRHSATSVEDHTKKPRKHGAFSLVVATGTERRAEAAEIISDHLDAGPCNAEETVNRLIAVPGYAGTGGGAGRLEHGHNYVENEKARRLRTNGYSVN
jgi:hypothetical protein